MVGSIGTSTRRWALSAAGPAAAAVLAACAGGEKGADADGAKTITPGKLTIWGATNDGGHWDGDLAKPFRTEFEGLYPGVTLDPLRIVTAGSSFSSPEEKFLAAAAGGEPPDLYSTGRAGTMSAWGLDGIVKALDDRMKPSKVIKAEKFLPLALEEGQWKGKTYALYHSADTRSLYWNKELYAAAGLNPDKPPDTWDEFADVIAKTTRRDGSTITQLGFHPTAMTTGPMWWEAWMWALGGKFLSDDGARPAFNGDTGIKALEWMQRIASLQGGMPAVTQFTAEAGAPSGQGGLFLIKKAATYVETSAMRVLLKSQYKDVRYSIANIPKSPAGKRASVRGGFSLVMPSGSKKQDAAWRFLEYHFTPETLARWNDVYERLPTTKEAAGSPLYLKNDPDRKVEADVTAYSQRVPAVHPAAFELQPLAMEIQSSVLSGGVSPKQALDTGAQKVQEILDKWKGR